MIIAIDGYSSCGKSTFARVLAEKLGVMYIDSGAMYRAVALLAIRNACLKQNKADLPCLKKSLKKANIEFRKTRFYASETWLNGENIEKEIREQPVSDTVSIISTIPFVREKLVQLQRQLAKNHHVVMDGRDIGTVVFPHADLKIFMVAGVDIRAERRFRELKEKGYEADYEEVKQNIIQRDRLDETREISPLKKAPDALVLDNSHMTVEEQMNWVMKQLET